MTRSETTSILLACLLACVCCVPAAAKHSDKFLLGTYSYLRNSRNSAQRVVLYRQMKELGYNSNLVETFEDNADLATMLKELDSYGLDVWISDKAWYSEPGSPKNYSSYHLSTNNLLRFEAEFVSEKEVKYGDSMDNQFWYAARSDKQMPRVGKPIDIAGASYGWVWQASMGKDRQGWLFTDLRYRWPNKFGAYVRFGKEFVLRQLDPPRHENSSIWVKYRFRISAVKKGLRIDEPLLRFDVSGYELQGAGFSPHVRVLRHLSQGRELNETVFRLNDHLLSAGGDFIEVTLQIPYSELLAANLMSLDHDGDPATPDSQELMRLVNLNPRVWWYGNCDVQLDYVEIEDQLHHDLVTDNAMMRKGIQERMQNIIASGAGNLGGFYTFDEPYLGQFEGFKLLEDAAHEVGTRVTTAIYDYQGKNFVLDKSNQILYDHVDAFRKLAQPQIIAPDIYPLTPDLKWGPKDKNAGLFIQDVLDQKLLRVYRGSMLYRDENRDRSFYTIVQVLGNWVNKSDGDRWQNWIQPPTATQKALLYLPLCYKPDGIIHYRLRVFHDALGYGNRAVVFSQVGAKNYPDPVPDPITWPAVASSNFRVLEYGKIIRGLNWLESETIGTKKARNSRWQKKNLIKRLQVLKQGNGDYEGYVECGFYQDKNGKPWFMLVNRRGNFFRPGAITAPLYVPNQEFAEYFPEAEAQIITFTFDKKKLDAYGPHPGLWDPYDRMFHPIIDNVAHILLPAGEGRLLQLVANKSNTGLE